MNKIGSKTKELWKDPEFRKKQIAAHKGKNTTHGMTETPFYHIWENMKLRCNSPKHNTYYRYGGRGIKVEWPTFEDFRDDMYESYLEHKKNNDTTSIERIDNDGNYSKSNCRWVRKSEQIYNTSRTIWIEHNGVRDTLVNWCRKLNLDYKLVGKRVSNGWTFERAMIEPVMRRRREPLNGIRTEHLEKEIDKLAAFFKAEMPEQIKEGSAVDNAIRVLSEMKAEEKRVRRKLLEKLRYRVQEKFYDESNNLRRDMHNVEEDVYKVISKEIES